MKITVNNRKYGFTLLEMSIVILVLSILFVGGINLYITIIELSEKNSTYDKMYTIDQAIKNYVLKNSRLPCPSDITSLAEDKRSRTESRISDGTCNVLNSNFLNGNFIFGGVPVNDLELPSDYLVDAWDSRIIYVVDKRYTTKQGFYMNGGSSIIIQDVNHRIATDRAIYILISPGQNQNGAFKAGYQNATDKSLLDGDNLYVDTAVNSFDNIFTEDVNSKLFDDIIYYSDKNALIFGLGLEDMPCNLKDLHYIDSNFSESSVYCNGSLCLQGVEVPSNIDCALGTVSQNPLIDSGKSRPSRMCQKYGQWSEQMYECKAGCGESNISYLTSESFPNSGDIVQLADKNFLTKIKIGNTITLDCTLLNDDISDSAQKRYGTITLRCDKDTLEWVVESDDCFTEADGYYLIDMDLSKY